MILVILKNDIKEKQGVLDGVYVMCPDQTNGKNAWINGSNAIWYDSRNDNWKIGSKSNIGTGKCSIRSTKDAQNPTLVGNNWEYHNYVEMIKANPGDITVMNVEGKQTKIELMKKVISMF